MDHLQQPSFQTAHATICGAERKAVSSRAIWRFARFSLALGWLSSGLVSPPASAENTPSLPGLKFTIQSAQPETSAARDVLTLPDFQFFVPESEAFSPFVPPVRFTATLEGFINLPLRGIYSFQADLRGSARLQLNGQWILDHGSNELQERTPLTAPHRLNRGPNQIKLVFENPEHGPAVLRLFWKSSKGLPQPIPAVALSFEPDAEFHSYARLQRGRALFLEHQCWKCHDSSIGEPIPEWHQDAPSFAGMGERRQRDWMAEWILDPKKQRSSARMPQLLHGPEAAKKAAAMALFLDSLNGHDSTSSTDLQNTRDPNPAAGGEKLFATLNCAACHLPPDGSQEATASLIPLDHVSAKFPFPALISFLLNPQEHYRWNPMPNFKLSHEEAHRLAEFLWNDPPSVAPHLSAGNDQLEEGRRLVQTLGCLNCHQLDLPNQHQAQALGALNFTSGSGCLNHTAGKDGQAPFFGFTEAEQRDLIAFAGHGFASLSLHAPPDFAARHVETLQCRACHDTLQSLPEVDLLGSRLRPEWAAEFIAGRIEEKPRPWLEQRMPSYPEPAREIARGLAMLHGASPDPAPPQTPSIELAETGRQLVSVEGGFACVSCHGVGPIEPPQLLEGHGINLVYSYERLRHDYFVRWMLNPQEIDPSTKMPVYFDEDGASPLIEVYGGDALEQIEALWHYLMLGREMPPPTGSTSIPSE